MLGVCTENICPECNDVFTTFYAASKNIESKWQYFSFSFTIPSNEGTIILLNWRSNLVSTSVQHQLKMSGTEKSNLWQGNRSNLFVQIFYRCQIYERCCTQSLQIIPFLGLDIIKSIYNKI